MLSYQHEYHAGNHADVLKHVVLTLLIDALQRKPSAIRVIDTHAGSGLYDLASPLTQRGREYERGAARVFGAGPPPPALSRYVEIVESLNPSGVLRTYPGSPQIAQTLLRPDDHLELFELHPRAFDALAARFRRDPRVHVHRRDGFEGLTAVVPPPERRGVVLVDPSYETREDYTRTLEAAVAAQRRWANGVYALWYPLIRKFEAERFIRRLRALTLPRLYEVELAVAGTDADGLRGSGIVVANLPFGVDRALDATLPWLHRRLAPEGAGGWRAGWLQPD